MKKFLFALLATGLMGSAFAQTTTPNNDNHKKGAVVPTSSTATVPGAKQATTQSLGELWPQAVVLGVAAVGVIVAVSSGGGHNNNSTGTTGTTP